MLQHKQTYVKVNAEVDEGVASLVEELSKFPLVETTCSCQGYPGKELAYIYMFCGHWEQACSFVFGTLRPAIGDLLEDSMNYITLTVTATHTDGPLIIFELPPEHIEKVVSRLRAFPIPKK